MLLQFLLGPQTELSEKSHIIFFWPLSECALKTSIALSESIGEI